MIERRLSKLSGVDTEGKTLRGLAAVYNSDSEDLGGFIERIAPGAFKRSLDSSQDVRGFWNHDSRLLLGRRSNGTLRLNDTDQGLAVEIDLPDTGFARDLAELVRRGDGTPRHGNRMSPTRVCAGGRSTIWCSMRCRPSRCRRIPRPRWPSGPCTTISGAWIVTSWRSWNCFTR
jgi:hypothetical protein